MAETLAGNVRPVQAAAFPPMAINIECQAPEEMPCAPVFNASRQICGHSGVLSASICFGFPYADVEEMGAATLVVTDGDDALATRLSRQLGGELWSRRHGFLPKLMGIDAAIEFVENLDAAETLDRPVCMLDMGDNVGAGSPADGTLIAEALHRRKIPNSFVCLYDPEAVGQATGAPPGTRLQLSVGAKSDAIHGRPLKLEVVLLGIYDGTFHEHAARHGGISSFDQGRTAVVRTDNGLTLMLNSKRTPPWSLAQLRSCGIDPATFRILVAKGVHSPIAAYREVCSRFIRVNTAGATSADLSTFCYRHRRRPMFPFESEAAWRWDDDVLSASK
jgi:microcystin degradation protein MlrC